MFTWILIAFVVALIFGVIKIEQIKEFVKKYEPKARELAKKYEPQARELLNKAKTVVEEKTAEIKKKSEENKAQTTVENKTAEPAEAPKAESSENQGQ